MEQKSLGYMLHNLVFILDRHSDEVLRKNLNLGYSQLKIIIAAKSVSGLKQLDIAKFLGQTEASVSRQIKLLKSQGLLSVQVDPSNRRARSIVLTDKGSELGKRSIEMLEQAHASVFGSLSFAEQKLMRELLDRLVNKACNIYK